MRRRSFCRLLAAAPIACLPALAAARQAQGELIDIVLEISDGGRVRLQGELSFREIDSLDWRARGRFEMDLQMNQPATTAVRDAQAGRTLQIKATVRPGKPPA